MDASRHGMEVVVQPCFPIGTRSFRGVAVVQQMGNERIAVGKRQQRRGVRVLDAVAAGLEPRQDLRGALLVDTRL
jgi:hypothetical protein